MKYFLKYLIRIIQIIIFLVLVFGAVCSVYLLFSAIGYPAAKDFLGTDLKGDLLVKGIPVVSLFLLLLASIVFLVILYLHIYVCSVLIMIINGSLGDLIEYMNVTDQQNMPYYLIFREGGLGIILKNKRETRRRFFLRWRTYF